MGSTGNALAAFRFAETSNVESVKITDLTVTQNSVATSSAFQNVTFYNGSNAVGTSGTASSTSPNGFTYKFHFATPVVVPKSGSLTLTLKGDVPAYSSLSNAGVDNTTSTFQVATTTVTALGASSNITTAVTGGATGNTMTVLRTVVTPSATTLGAASNRTKSSVDNLATVTFTANSAGSSLLKTLKLTFTGSAVTSTLPANVTLRDTNNGDVVASDNATVTSTVVGSTATMTWTFATSTAGTFVISGGTSYTFTVQSNDTAGMTAGSSNLTQGLGITIQGTGDVSYSDSGDTTGSTVNLPSTIVPLNVASISFTQGS